MISYFQPSIVLVLHTAQYRSCQPRGRHASSSLRTGTVDLVITPCWYTRRGAGPTSGDGVQTSGSVSKDAKIIKLLLLPGQKINFLLKRCVQRMVLTVSGLLWLGVVCYWLICLTSINVTFCYQWPNHDCCGTRGETLDHCKTNM